MTPPGGTVLDPFVGSGTTACAVLTLNAEGHDFKCRGIEKEAEYVEIARARVAWYAEHAEEWLKKMQKKRRKGRSGVDHEKGKGGHYD